MNEENKSPIIITVILFIISIIVIWYGSSEKLKQERKITVENKIASEYCGNLSNKTAEDWDNCYNNVSQNIIKKFEILELCKKQNNKESKEWSQKEWANCYETQDLIEQISNN